MSPTDAPTAVVEAISRGLKAPASLANAKLAEVAPERRNNRGWPRFIIAAQLVGSEFTGDEVGIWATGGNPESSSFGPILAVNDAARTYTSWGEAAQPGSRADEIMNLLASYAEAVAAEQAVRST